MVQHLLTHGLIIKTLRRTGQWLFGLLASAFVLSILLVFLISLPPVQNQLVKAAANWLEQQLGTEVYVGRVSLGLPAEAVLEEVYVLDRQGEVLLSFRQFRMSMLTFSLWRYLLRPEEAQSLQVNRISLVQPHFYLYRSRQDSLLNLNSLLMPLRSPKASGPKKRLQPDLIFSEIAITDGRFSWADSTRAEIDSLYTQRLNFSKLDVEEINGVLGLGIAASGRLAIRVDDLRLKELYSGMEIHQFRLDLLQDTLHAPADQGTRPVSFVRIKNLFAHTGQTLLSANIFLPNETLSDLFDARLQEQWEVELKPSVIDIQSINYFVPNPLPISGIVRASGNISGDMDRLFCPDFEARLQQHTHLRASWTLRNLLDASQLEMDIRFQKSRFDGAEIQQFLPTVTLPPAFTRIDSLVASGSFLGKYYDFNLHTSMRAATGELDAKMAFSFPPAAPIITYQGQLNTRRFNLNALGIEGFQASKNLNMQAYINGSGSSWARLKLFGEAYMAPSEVMDYYVDTAHFAVTIDQQKLDGNVYVSDGEGFADLVLNVGREDEQLAYQADGYVNRLNIQKYLGYKQPIWFTSTLKLDLRGDSLENTNGQLKLTQTQLQRIGDTARFHIADFYMQSDSNSARYTGLNINSSLLDASLYGNFPLNKGWQFANRLLVESKLYFANDDSLIQAYYAQKPVDSTDVHIDFWAVSGEEINEVFRFLEEPVYISPGDTARASFDFSQIEQAELSASADSVSYRNLHFQQFQLHLNLIKYSRRNYLLLAGDANIDSMKVADAMKLERVKLSLSGEDRELETHILAEQKGGQNYFQAILHATFFPEGHILTTLTPLSRLTLGPETWRFSSGNAINFSDDGIRIQGLRMFRKDKYVNIYGEISHRPESRLMVELESLELKNVPNIVEVPYGLNGVLTASLQLGNLLNAPFLAGGGKVDGFGIEDFIYGDLGIEAQWQDSLNHLLLRAQLYDEQLKDTTLKLAGTYHIGRPEPLNFRVETQNPFPLNYIYPFVKTQLYGIKGKVDLASFTIGGSFDDLDVRGTGYFTEAGFGVDYFKTEYTFDGLIEFDKNLISFPRRAGKAAIVLKDQNQHKAELYGAIRHNGMREFEFDLQIDKMNNFLIMDTGKEDNEWFYGTVYIKNGVAAITGNLDKLNVQAFAISGARSHLRIPISFESEVSKPEFIQFVGEETNIIQKRKTGLQGFELNLTVQATEEAQVDLIFDERVGDIIQGRGEGTINLVINEEGEFYMYGDYEIVRGDYLFTARNIINKKFEIKPGGHITWNGDPYSATLKLDATYPLYADISQLINKDESIRVPVNVLMHLEGSLLQPEIDLSIELPSVNEQDAIELLPYLKTVQYDEQELNKQVFSLMVFNRFAPTGGFLGDQLANTGVTTSISEMLSNQLNYWVSRAIDEKVRVSVGSSNFQDINLLVSAKLFNDRVTIERDGSLVNATNSTGLNVGNVSIIIKLLPARDNTSSTTNRRPSELVLEVFSRENANFKDIRNNQVQTGIGIFFKKDFDNLRDLLMKVK